MPILLSDVGRRGRLALEFASHDGATTLRNVYCEVPFKVTRLLAPRVPEIAHLIVMHCTAGLFGGDSVECDIHVKSGARVLITQQSATKVHPAAGKCAVQQTRIRVDTGAELYMYLEPVIPFAGSLLRQTTRIEVAPGARLYYWESLMGGRVGRGEVWQFNQLSSETSLWLDSRLLYLDRFSITPMRNPPLKEWMMGNAPYLATGLCFDERAADFAGRLHSLCPAAGVDTPAPAVTVARIVAASGPDFRRARAVFEENTVTLTEYPRKEMSDDPRSPTGNR